MSEAGSPEFLVHGEIIRFKIKRYIKQRMLNFWVHIVTSKANKMSHAQHNKIKDHHNQGEFQSHCLSYIISNLRLIELTIDYMREAHPEDLNYNQMTNILMRNYYCILWKSEIEISSACDF